MTRGVLSSPSRTRLVLAVGLAVWVANAVIQLVWGSMLGHDESQYAIAARDMLAGHPARWFYVSNGMHAVAAPGVLAGGSELVMRIVPFGFGLGFVLAAWQLARSVFGADTAAWTVAVLAGSRSVVRVNVELLSDMPAAACLLAATAVIACELGRADGPRWRIAWTAPLLAAALYIRYGSCVPIAIIAVLAAVFGGATIARRPAPVIATAALFVLLFVPHAVMAIHATGSPFGVLLQSEGVPLRRSLLDGLATYVASNPFDLYGGLPPVVMVAGVLGLRRDRRIAWLWLAAIADIVALGLLTHAQTRYILFGTTLLVILGTAAILRLLAACPPLVRLGLAAGAIAAIAFGWFTVTHGSLRHREKRAAHNPALVAAISAIAFDVRATPGPCHVLGNAYTQLEWYTGCSSADVAFPDAFARGEPIYLVSQTGAGFAQQPGRPRAVLDIPGLVHVVRLDPPSAPSLAPSLAPSPAPSPAPAPR